MIHHTSIIKKPNNARFPKDENANRNEADGKAKGKVIFQDFPDRQDDKHESKEPYHLKEPNTFMEQVTCQRTFQVKYLGNIILDRYYTHPMLPWLIVEVKHRAKKSSGKSIYLEITDTTIIASKIENNITIFKHNLSSITKMTQIEWDPKCFGYCVKQRTGEPTTCFVFQASEDYIVRELLATVKGVRKEMVQHQSSLNLASSHALEMMLSNSQQFEVLFLGRIKVTSKRAPPSFIDEAVEKFRKLDHTAGVKEKYPLPPEDEQPLRQRHGSGSSVSSLPNNLDTIEKPQENLLKHQLQTSSSFEESIHSSTENLASSGSTEAINEEPGESSDPFDKSPSNPEQKSPTITFGHSLISHTQSMDTYTRQALLKDLHEMGDKLMHSSTVNLSQIGPPSENESSTSGTVHLDPGELTPTRVRSFSGDAMRPLKQTSLPPYRTRVASGGMVDMKKSPTELASLSRVCPNRTMLFLIGQLELCMISPDKKQVLLSKTFNDISHCSKGIDKRDHFGFICREMTAASNDSYVAYVFRCQTERVVDELMSALKQAFQNAHKVYQRQLHQRTICDTCPMTWYHKLCLQLEGLSADKCQSIIMNKISNLAAVDQENIMERFQGAEVFSYEEQNEVFMMLIRSLCEQKQMKHTHGLNRIELVSGEKKLVPSKFNSLRQKAKKSLSNSFETILKFTIHDNLEEEAGEGLTSPALKKLDEHSPEGGFSTQPRPRSSTIGTTRDVHREKKAKVKSPETPTSSKSPIMNMFIKVGSKSPPSPSTITPEKGTSGHRGGSWRQAIFNKVQTPIKQSKGNGSEGSQDTTDASMVSHSKEPRSRAELRALWKKAIMEQILLIRMDRENKKLQASQDAASHKRMRLDYEEVTPCLKEAALRWDQVLESFYNEPTLMDKSTIYKLVKDGVPRHKRGAIWQFLVDHHCLQEKLLNTASSPVDNVDLSVSYESHLSELTSHQHAILIDLGRTFPSHPYFSQPLGPGQLALFNLLKAYSLMDTEVGYCQGLSFVAGVLLLHMSEEKAFELLKHIQYRLGFRRQYKQPDMIALHIQMYQLSRLLHDLHPELYRHFDAHEISPTLYAAPWFLTFFASQFPLGFVARLFDLVFLQGMEAIFKVALVLLGNHQDTLLQCQTFESIMDCIKTVLPAIDIIQMERIFNQVFAMNITRNLHAYEVEYHVLQEEMMYTSPKEDTDKVKSLELANNNLKSQNMELLEQLQVARGSIHQLESTISNYQSSLKKLETRVTQLEEERDALLHTISALRQQLDTSTAARSSPSDPTPVNNN